MWHIADQKSATAGQNKFGPRAIAAAHKFCVILSTGSLDCLMKYLHILGRDSGTAKVRHAGADAFPTWS